MTPPEHSAPQDDPNEFFLPEYEIMRTITWSLKGILLSAGLFLCFTPGMARAEDQAVGVVRIADGKAEEAISRDGSGQDFDAVVFEQAADVAYQLIVAQAESLTCKLGCLFRPRIGRQRGQALLQFAEERMLRLAKQLFELLVVIELPQ